MSADRLPSKSELRRRTRDAVAGLDAEYRRGASLIASGRVVEHPLFTRAKTVLLYIALPDEIDVTAIGNRGLRDGKRACVPLVDWDAGTMTAVETQSFDPARFVDGGRGLIIPVDPRPVPTTEIDLVIVPGRAFDANGRRLGRGGGFYDRFLPRLRDDAHTIGIAFAAQIVDQVPTDTHDCTVHGVVTEHT